MRVAREARLVVVMGALAGLATATIWSLRVGWADVLARRETPEATQTALRWTPDQAVYYFRLGVLTAETDPARSLAALERAVALNPSYAAAWIELGLRWERDGKASLAEECLLRAAEADRQYLPRWTLANLYFRRTDPEKFLLWAKAASEMVYGDATPLFRLCAQMKEDGNLIERLAIARPDVRANYLSYLINRGRVDIIMPAARKVLQDNRQPDVAILLEACDRLLDERHAESAMEIWNGLVERHRIPFEAVGGTGPGVTNGGFSATPSSHGFDWRLLVVEGVSASSEESPGGLRLAFSGSQPENCELLAQFVTVRQQEPYELRFVYRTDGIQPDTGLRWRITDACSGGTLAEGENLSSDQDRDGRVSFRTAPGCRLARIALEYRRAAGTARISGFVALRAVEVRPPG